ncbi:MAG: tetratricopeptide repeat protein [bacterium]
MLTFRRFVITLSALGAAVIAQNVPLDALLRGGRIHYQGGRYERAREQFQKALDQYGTTTDNTTLATIHLWLGLCEAQLNHLQPAADHFLKAVEKDSELINTIRDNEQQEYWVWTAFITASRGNYANGDYEMAINYARAALKIHPDRSQPYSIITNAYSNTGKYEEMLTTARQMLALNAGSAEAYSTIGLYFFQKPDSAWITAQTKQGRWDSVYHYYSAALKIYQTRLDSALKELGNLLKTSDTNRIRAVADSLVERQRFSPPEELKRYIEKNLKGNNQLEKFAQIASRLFYLENNLNATAARLGTALLRASAETKRDTAERYRVLAESLFREALKYDRFDYTTMFNLGIAQYQGRNDSLAATTFGRVIAGTVVPLAVLPSNLVNQLVAQISPEAAKTGYLQLTDDLLATTDSILLELGFRGGSYAWLYFPDRGEQKDFPLSPTDTAGMFLSMENPAQLENIYLLYGISQTGFGLAQIEASKTEFGKNILSQAISNLLITTKINPKNAEAYLNLVHCYRETGNKDKAAWAYDMYKKLSKSGEKR